MSAGIKNLEARGNFNFNGFIPCIYARSNIVHKHQAREYRIALFKLLQNARKVSTVVPIYVLYKTYVYVPLNLLLLLVSNNDHCEGQDKKYI